MIFDIIFAIIFIWAAFRGFTRGLIMQLTTLAAIILGIFCSIRFTGYVSEYLSSKYIAGQEYISIIVFTITFIIILIIVYFIGKITERLIEAMFLGLINRILGSIFAIIKYAFLVSTILVILNTINNSVRFLPDQKVRESNLYRPLSALVPALFPKIFNTVVPPVNLPNKFRQEKSV